MSRSTKLYDQAIEKNIIYKFKKYIERKSIILRHKCHKYLYFKVQHPLISFGKTIKRRTV